MSETKEPKEPKHKKEKKSDIHKQIVYHSSSGLELSKDQLSLMTLFQKKPVSKY